MWRELFHPRRPELWVDGEEQLRALTALLQPPGPLAVDTEFLLFPHYRSSLQILQVASPSIVAAVDCHALRSSPALAAFVASLFAHQLIVHSAKGDMEVLYDLCTRLHVEPRVPPDVFDCQIAAAYAGYGGMVGYGPLLLSMYGVALNKSQTLTDWSARPLTRTQLEYCFGDVRHLHCIREDLLAELAERGRVGWLEEELRCLPNPGLYAPVKAEDAWRQVWAAAKLKDFSDELSVLREVSAFRETTCARVDMAPQLFMRAEVLLALAVQMPDSLQQLQGVQGLKPSVLRRWGRQLLAAVQRGRQLPAEERGGLHHRRLNHQQSQRLKGGLYNLLSSRAQSVAVQHSISVFHLAPRNELMDLASVSEAAIERVKALPPDAFHPVPMISNFWGVKAELLPRDLSTAPRALFEATRRADDTEGGGQSGDHSALTSPASPTAALSVDDEVEMLCRLKLLSGWRRQLVGEELLTIASGRDSLTWREQSAHLSALTPHAADSALSEVPPSVSTAAFTESGAVVGAELSEPSVEAATAGAGAAFAAPTAAAEVSLARLAALSAGEHSTAEALLSAWATALTEEERRRLSAAAAWLVERLDGAHHRLPPPQVLRDGGEGEADEELRATPSPALPPSPPPLLLPQLLSELRLVVERLAGLRGAEAPAVKRRRGRPSKASTVALPSALRPTAAADRRTESGDGDDAAGTKCDEQQPMSKAKVQALQL